MIVLGISGFFNIAGTPLYRSVSPHFYHDAAAAVIINGQVVAAAEQERFDRIKHSNNFPLDAIACCLEVSGIRYRDIDYIAFFFSEEHTDRGLLAVHLEEAREDFHLAKDLILGALEMRFGRGVDRTNIKFVRHHEAHAACAFLDRPSREETLVCVVDGAGENESISLFLGAEGHLTLLREYDRTLSIGHFYGFMTDYLGFGGFGEYKVMGLAAYGDPGRLKSVVANGYELLPDGRFSLNPEEIARSLAVAGVGPRHPGGSITASERDTAAAVQEVVNEVLLHILRHAKRQTGARSLCLSGGVAQNSSMNGVIARSELFEEMYVHYAPHDSGAALGAALLVTQEEMRASNGNGRTGPVKAFIGNVSPFLGASIGDRNTLSGELAKWRDLIEYEEIASIGRQIADPIARGSLVGIARGRAEFGPRALGNRSIVADPRHVESREKVNVLVKGREQFRPLAPAVLREAASDFFVLPDCHASLEYMGVVVNVRSSAREVLKAVTHVDGTARLQIVDRDTNPWLYALIKAYAESTGVPVLLNTSFNNYFEPIVQTPSEALECFMSTGLDLLVLGGYVVVKKMDVSEAADYLTLEVRADVRLVECREIGQHDEHYLDAGRRGRILISRELALMLALTPKPSVTSFKSDENLMTEVMSLWQARYVRISPTR